jgi:phosphoserine phosphatase RsbU/P
VMLGAPLLAGDDLLGVLHVGRLQNRPFTDHDVGLLQVVAERVAGAIQGRTLAVQRAAAALLERSLLPEQLPHYPGLELAARYVPAQGKVIGGDWYDVFALPSGQLWIVVGDVAGHGIEASIVMGRIRSALRAYSLLDLPQEEVLRLVDRKVDHFEFGTLATVACAVTAPPYDTLTVALAGHVPPVIAHPDKPPEVLAIRPGPPLGSGWSDDYTPTTLPMTLGTTVVLYTDGLVERRDESIDLGIERLRTAISPSVHPRELTASLMHQLVGTTVAQDDIALVVLRTSVDPG